MEKAMRTKILEIEVEETEQMQLTQFIAEGTSGDWKLTWSHVIPLGLRVLAENSATNQRVKVFLDERKLFELMSDAAINFSEESNQ